MDLGLSDKTALVGASSKGLGLASALALAREGARVTICARGEPDLEAAAARIREETGAEVLAVSADLNDGGEIERVVAATVEHFGSLDVLVNNSGGPARGVFAELDDDAWRAGFEVVTLNFVRFVRAALPHMRARGWGRIVGIQSLSVKQPVPVPRSLQRHPPRHRRAGEGADARPRQGRDHDQPRPARHVRHRAHPPGAREPGRRRARAGARRVAPLTESIPIGRLGEPAELGDLVAFLASEQASYITGAVYQVDGGAIRSSL